MGDSDKKANDSSASAVVTPKSLITESNVRAALTADKGANARLVAWKVVDFTKQGDNFVCVVSSVEVKYELDDQSSEVVYVVKLNPCSSSLLAEIACDVLIVKEAGFYLNLVPELNCMLKEIGQKELNFPKCFHAYLEKGREIMFMEDLRKRGYKMVDGTRGLNEAHAMLVLRELARLHAASLLLQNKHPGEDLTGKYPCLKKDWHGIIAESEDLFMVMKNNLEFVQEIFRKVEGYERAVAWIDTLIPKLVDIIYEQLKCGEPKVVGHGDCWSNNLLFRYDKAGNPEDVMMLDLQLVCYGPPTPDLNYFIYSSTTGDVRKANLQAFLNCYHEAFGEIMEEAGQEAPFTKEQLSKDYRGKNLYGAIFATMLIPIVMFESNDTVDSSIENHEYFNENMTNVRARVMDTLDTNPLLKPRLLSVFDDMMEGGLIP